MKECAWSPGDLTEWRLSDASPRWNLLSATTVLDVRCLTLRPNTERPVTVTLGTNRLVTPEGLGAAVDAALAGELRRPGEGPPLWDGRAGERIVGILAAVVGVPEAIA